MLAVTDELVDFDKGYEVALKETFGDELGELLMKELSILEDEVDDGCEDNFRVVLIGDEEGEAAYDRALGNGCCGFEDKEVTVNGQLFRVGCNFGH